MRKNRKKVWTGIGAVSAAAAIAVAAAVLIPVQEAAASARLTGIQQVVDELNNEPNSVYTVVEIVPGTPYQTMGYMVKGSEPELSDKLLSDSLTKEARVSKAESYLSPLKDAGIISKYTYKERLYNTSEKSVLYYPGKLTLDAQVETRTGMYLPKNTFEDLAAGANYDYLSKLGASLRLLVKPAGAADFTAAAPSYTPNTGDELKFEVIVDNRTVQELQNVGVRVISVESGVENTFDQKTVSAISGNGNNTISMDASITIPSTGIDKKWFAEVTYNNTHYYSKMISVQVGAAASTTTTANVTVNAQIELDTDGNPVVNTEDEFTGTVISSVSSTIAGITSITAVDSNNDPVRLTESAPGEFSFAVNSSNSSVTFSVAVNDSEWHTTDATEIMLSFDSTAPVYSGTLNALYEKVEAGAATGSYSSDVPNPYHADEMDPSSFTYVGEGNGAYVFVDDENGAQCSVEYTSVYYSTSAVSTGLLGDAVFEIKDTADNAALLGKLQVKSYTPVEFNTAIANGEISMNDIDMMYIGNSSLFIKQKTAGMGDYYEYAPEQKQYTNDLVWDVAYDIYESVINTGMPVIMDSSIMDDTETGTETDAELLNYADGEAANNTLRLAYLLRNYAAINTGHTSVFAADHSEAVWDEVFVNTVTAPSQKVSISPYGLVSGSVFIHNDQKGDANILLSTTIKEINAQAGTVKTNSLVDPMFSWDWKNEELKEGDADVDTILTGASLLLSEISEDAFYQTTGGSGESITEYASGDITQATVVKYIVNYFNRRVTVYKDAITVLDLEPGKYSNLNEQTVRSWLSPKESELISTINIVQMTTSEYIGKLTDLEEDYDLVYIGSYNGGNNDYLIDKNPSGLVYSHIGKVRTRFGIDGYKPKYAGLLESEYITSEVYEDEVEYYFDRVDSTSLLTKGDYIIISAADQHALASEDLSMTNSVSLDPAEDLEAVRAYLWHIEPSERSNGKYTVKAYGNAAEYLSVNTDKDPHVVQKANEAQELSISVNSGAVRLGYAHSAYEYVEHETVTVSKNDDYSNYVNNGYYYVDGNNYHRITSIYGTGRRNNWRLKVRWQGGEKDLIQNQTFRVAKKVPIPAVNDTIHYADNGLTVSAASNTDTGEFSFYKVRTELMETGDPVLIKRLRNERTTTIYSGNDITEEKMMELLDYVEANYPVVISSRLMSASGEAVSANIDTTSYMYQFISAAGKKANVYNDTKNSIDANFSKYLNMSKLYLTMINRPTDYTDGVAVGEKSTNFLSKNTDGKYSLDYTIEFSNSSLAGNSTTYYTVQLFQDVNADGKYAPEENLDGLTVTKYDNNERVEADHLEAGVRYNVSRQLPDSLVGLIPWRIMVTMNGTKDTVHTSEIGYAAIDPSTQGVAIQVLQIIPDALTVDMTKSPFESLIEDDMPRYGYNITINQKTVDKVTQEYLTWAFDRTETNTTDRSKASYVYHRGGTNNVQAYYEYLYKNYDMLILGFADDYEDFGVDEVAQAIEMYIASGRPVLFSHDTTSNTNASIGEMLAGNVRKVDGSGSDLYADGYIEYFYFFDDAGEMRKFRLYENGGEKYFTNENGRSRLSGDNGIYTINGKDVNGGVKYYTLHADLQWDIIVTDDSGSRYPVGYKSNYQSSGGDNPGYLQYWGYAMNASIRDLVGMDRYGITNEKVGETLSKLSVKTETQRLASNADIAKLIQDQKAENKDRAYMVDSGMINLTDDYSSEMFGTGVKLDMYVQGYTNTMVEYNCVNDYSEQRTTEVNQVNRGQITTYPYNLNCDLPDRTPSNTGYFNSYDGNLPVAKTHVQYYQLDMRLDKTKDGQSDIVVWYCLGGNYYDQAPNDVRNNYYIYSAGNVTYTGMGHSKGDRLSPEEAKLFVNTIIAAYNAGVKDPTITITEKDSRLGLDYIYRTFDSYTSANQGDSTTVETPEADVINGAVTETTSSSIEASGIDETIGFYVDDYNILQGHKRICFWFYKEVEAGTAGAIQVGDAYVVPYTEEELGLANSPVSLDKLSAYSIDNYTFTDGTVGPGMSELVNSQRVQVTLNGAWIDEQLKAADTDQARFYIGAWTVLDFSSTRPDEITGISFDKITIKKRELTDLD